MVETNIHHPTDSTLLGDRVRVITRTVKKLEGLVGKAEARFRDRTRSVLHQIFEIVQQSRRAGKQLPAKMRAAYRRLIGTTRAVLREAERAVEGARRKARQAGTKVQAQVKELRQHVAHLSELTRQVVAQTRARVLEGDTHYPHKIFSVFETHTEAVRKGKAGKPTEFGKAVKIQEAGKSVHHGLRSVRPAGGGPSPVEAAAGAASGAVRPPTGVGHGGWRLCLGGQRASGPRAVGETRGLAAARERPAPLLALHPSFALVRTRAPLADRFGRAHQRLEASPRPASLSLPRVQGDATLGRLGGDR